MARPQVGTLGEVDAGLKSRRVWQAEMDRCLCGVEVVGEAEGVREMRYAGVRC